MTRSNIVRMRFIILSITEKERLRNGGCNGDRCSGGGCIICSVVLELAAHASFRIVQVNLRRKLLPAAAILTGPSGF